MGRRVPSPGLPPTSVHLLRPSATQTLTGLEMEPTLGAERDQHPSKFTKGTKSELELETSILKSTLAWGPDSQNWTGVAAAA